MTWALAIILPVVAIAAAVLAYRLHGDGGGRHTHYDDGMSAWLDEVRTTRATPGIDRRLASSMVRHAKAARRSWTPIAAAPLRAARAAATARALQLAALTRPEREEREERTGRPWRDNTGSFTAITTGDK